MVYRWGPGAVGGFWWLVGLACLVFLIAGIVWLVAYAVRGGRHVASPQQPWQPPFPAQPPYQGQSTYPAQPSATPAARPTPYEILRERLARGEMTVEEYQRTLAALGPDPAAPPHGQPPQPPSTSR
jgi:uncharacterized membrane protein